MATRRDPMNLAYIMSADSTAQSRQRAQPAQTGNAAPLGVLTTTCIPNSTTQRMYFAKVRREWPDVLCIKTRSFEILEVDKEFKLKVVASRDDLDGCIVSSLVLPDGSRPRVTEDVRNTTAKSWEMPVYPPPLVSFKLPRQIIVLTVKRALERTLIFTFGYTNDVQQTLFGIHTESLPNVDGNTMGTHMAADPRGRLMALATETGTLMIVRLKSWDDLKGHVEFEGRVANQEFKPIQEASTVEIKGVKRLLTMEFVSPPEDSEHSAYLVAVVESNIGSLSRLLVFKIDCNRPLGGQDPQPMRSIPLGTSDTPGLNRSPFIIPLQYQPGLFLCAENNLAMVSDVRNPRFEPQTLQSGENETEVADDPGFFWPRPLYRAWSCPWRTDQWLMNSHKETVYLCRQDGQIKHLFLTAEPGRRSRFDATFLGHIHHNVDQAFAAIDLPWSMSYDSFLAGGSHSNGASLSVRPAQRPQPQSIILSSSPVNDYTIIPGPATGTIGNNRVFATTNRGRKHGTISEMRHGCELRILEEVSNEDDITSVAYLPGRNPGYLLATAASTTRLHPLRQKVHFWRDDDRKFTPAELEEPDLLSQIVQGDNFVAINKLRDGDYLLVTQKSIERVSSDFKKRREIAQMNVNQARIIRAIIDSFNAHVLCVVATTTQYEMHFFDAGNGSQLRAQSAAFDSEPSCICSYSMGNNRFAVMSTQHGNLEFYQVHGMDLVHRKTYNLHHTDGVCENIVVLHRVNKESEGQPMSLVCGLRSGALMVLDMHLNGGDLVVLLRDSVSLGMTSVRAIPWFAIDAVAHGRAYKAIVFCENACYLYIDTGHKFNKSTLIQLWFADHHVPDQGHETSAGRGDGCYQTSILSIATCPPWLTIPSQHTEDENTKWTIDCDIKRDVKEESPEWDMETENLARKQAEKEEGEAKNAEKQRDREIDRESIFCVTRSGILKCRIIMDEKPRHIPWQIPIGGDPVRVIWSTHHKRLVAGLHINFVADTNPEARSRDSKKTTFPAVKIIDPKHENESIIEDQSYKQSPLPPVQVISEKNIEILRSGETITALAEWQVGVKGKLYHMLLVATEEHLRMYNFQAADGPLDLRTKVSDQAKDKILGIAVFTSTSFVALTRHHLIVYSIEEHDGKLSFRQSIRKNLGSMEGERHISIRGAQVTIGTRQHGLQIYELRGNSFEHVFSDTSGGITHDVAAITINTNTVISAIQSGPNPSRLLVQARQPIQQEEDTTNIIGHVFIDPQSNLESPPRPVTQACRQLPHLFQATLPVRITRLQALPSSQYPDENPNNTRPQRLLASAQNGTFYTLTILPAKRIHLLKLLSNLIEREQKTLCPFMRPSIKFKYQSVIPDINDQDPASRGVDGDLLARLLRMEYEEARRFVDRLLKAEDNGSSDGNESERIQTLFRDGLGAEAVQKAGGLAEALIEFVREHVDAL